MRICVVIPVLNEAKTIGHLIEGVKNYPLDIVVIDDGSHDNSGEISRKSGAVVIRHIQRQGKGKSLRDGFDYVMAQHFDGVITMDGDGQHDVDDLKIFLDKAKENDACVIVGNRMHEPQGMPLIRYLTNGTMSFLISCVCRQRIPDSQCGFRYMSTEILRTLSLSSDNYEIESEVLIHASKRGYKIYSVPIRSIYRDEASKIRPGIDTLRFLKFILKETFSSRLK